MINKRSVTLASLDILGLILAYSFIVFVAKFEASYTFLIISIGLVLICNMLLGTYKQLWRFTSFRELQVIFVSYFASFSALLILNSIHLTTVTPIPLFNFFSLTQ